MFFAFFCVVLSTEQKFNSRLTNDRRPDKFQVFWLEDRGRFDFRNTYFLKWIIELCQFFLFHQILTSGQQRQV